MDLSQAVAAGVSAGLSGGSRKRARSVSRSGSKKAKSSRTLNISGSRIGEYLPSKVITRHTYCDGRSIANGSGTLGTWQLRLNSMYDPDLTYTGHQPMGFDQVSANYSRYLVHKVKVTIQAHFTGNDGLTIPTMAFHPSNSASAFNGLIGVVGEQARGEEFLLYAGYSPFKVSRTYNMWDLVGVSKSEYLGDWARFGADVSTNPVENICFQLSHGTSSAVGTDISTVVYRIRMDFVCEWSDRPPLNQS
jgi:hypothetical protein